jgi:phage shock protein PspC (stress-responsive transcriptional regulator)
MIGGVAAGLARHLEVDVVWVRLAFVLTAIFASGLGLVAYLAAWVIIPAGDAHDAGSSSRTAPEGAGSARFWVGVGLIGLGSLVLLDRLLSPLQARLGWISPSQVLVPLAIIVVGALLWRSSRGEPVLSAAATGRDLERDVERFAERFEEETELAAGRLEQWIDDGGALADPVTPGTAPGATAGAATTSRIAPATLGLALVAAGAIWLLSGLGIAGATVTRALAAALLVIGSGLVVSAFVGRGRGLIGAGLILSPIVLIATLAGHPHTVMPLLSLDDGVVVVEPDAVVEERPQDLAAVQDTYTFSVGSVVLDLRALDASELAAAGTTRITVEFGVGDLRILLPDDVTVDVRVALGIGQVDIAGRTSGGLGVNATRTLVAGSADAGTLVLDIEQGIGRVRVER